MVMVPYGTVQSRTLLLALVEVPGTVPYRKENYAYSIIYYRSKFNNGT